MIPTPIFAILAVALVARVNAGTPRQIVNGSPATVGEFPYQASLRLKGRHFCGGAIVTPRHVMTAAHCVTHDFDEPIKVVIGTISSSDGEVHDLSEIVYHEKYQVGYVGSPFDIAVITLADNITFNESQNKIDLPTAPAPDGVMATASGWGWLSASLPSITPLLNKIQLRTMSANQCQRIFGRSARIYSNQICTLNGPGFGVCGGDSGGPLAYNGTLIGIVSWGIPCGDGYPDVHTSVYHLVAWVNSIINA